MKFSYNWIREYVDGMETPARDLERLITMKTAECEGIEPWGASLAQACAARVVSVEPIANSHNRKAVVETGPYGIKTVVCGAPNCREGMVTAYVPAGIKIIGGVESDGMLASGAELGLNRDAAGILELDSQTGSPLPGCVPDSIIEIDNKSITHRPDLWGHLGMAREVAAIARRGLIDPVNAALVPAAAAPIGIEIENPDLCARYSALVFEHVKVGPSPLWLQCRLTAIGLNPINNIVDLTNYIMAELAQPMHAFDRDLLHGDTIFVRLARGGERIMALNDEAYDLTPLNLVIADAAGPIAIAGVIGGRDSAISEKTTNIVFESANFHAGSVRKTSAALKLRTDASIRFEKSQDPVNTVRGLARAVELMREVAPGARLVGGLADRLRPIPAPPPIRLPLDWLVRKLGRDVPAEEVRDILEHLAFGVTEPEPRVFSVAVPSWRATKDISIKDDLVEEVGRMIGYGSIEPTAPAVLSTVPPPNHERLFHRSVRSIFTNQGFTEVYNYSFVSEEQVTVFGWKPELHVRVANPIASDQALMRASLLPGILKNIAENSKHFAAFRLFEIGREIHSSDEGPSDEVPHLAAAIYDKEAVKGGGEAALLELKRAAECLMPRATVRPAAAQSYEHPSRTADVLWRGSVAGRLFELHPTVLAAAKVDGRAAILDLDLRVIQSLRVTDKKYAPVRRYPSSEFDLSVIAGSRELVGDLETKLADFAGELLIGIQYLRQYSGPPLPEGMRSVSFRLVAGSPERTLSSEEVAQVRARVIEGMRALGYELRV